MYNFGSADKTNKTPPNVVLLGRSNVRLPTFSFVVTFKRKEADKSIMALPLPPGLSPSEVAFLCEMELVTVIPRQRLEGLELLGVSGTLENDDFLSPYSLAW